jgi:class 3 adenylate cyclase/pimeloyl-ACP methyl ester carboxylesterase
MEQEIRFCTTSDGVRIAYAAVGEGPPLVLAWGWIGNLQFEWNYPDWRAFLEGLAQGRRLVRLDKRGTGLSDWDAPNLTIDGQVCDLETVVDALELESFALMGVSEGGPAAIIYTARHPERVSRLIFYGSYPRWPFAPGAAEPVAALVRSQWGMGSAALSAAFVPSGDPAKAADFTECQRVSASGENAARWLEAFVAVDTTSLLKDIRVPTLILHRRHDRVCPFRAGRELAALIPGARLEPLEGDIHVPFWGDSEALLDAIHRFLQEGVARIQLQAPAAVPGAPLTILFTDVEGSTALTQRLGDAKARQVMREHERITREALKAHGGTEVKALGDGFMACFSSATKALECAIAMQQAFAEHNAALLRQAQDAHTEPVEVRIRVGLNAGEPIAEDEDLFGTAVILAARIAAKAEGGEILASDVVRQLVAGKGFLFSDRGDVVLRGFEDPVRLYEVRWPEDG